MADEVKHKVLAFLLQNAEDLLVTSGCPIKKVSKYVIVSDGHLNRVTLSQFEMFD